MHAKTLHTGKGEIVGFTKPETNSVTYIATTNEISIEEYVDMLPRNQIPKRKCKPLGNAQNINRLINCLNLEEVTRSTVSESEKCDKSIDCFDSEDEVTGSTISDSEKCDKLINHHNEHDKCVGLRAPLCLASENVSISEKEINRLNTKSLHQEKLAQKEEKITWQDINEVIELDFLISYGDIYPNRQVELEDAQVLEEMKQNFEDICNHNQEAFSKNNRYIGKTQLIEMKIDTGISVPLAQSPYTLPLKHYGWVRNEIEMYERQE